MQIGPMKEMIADRTQMIQIGSFASEKKKNMNRIWIDKKLVSFNKQTNKEINTNLDHV